MRTSAWFTRTVLPASQGKKLFQNERWRARKSVVELEADAMPDRYGAILCEGGVRFIQPAGSARTIAVTGGFCGWSPEGFPLIRDESGRFFEAFFPLAAGRYEYHVLIDGVPGPDAFVAARAVSLDGPDRSIVTV